MGATAIDRFRAPAAAFFTHITHLEAASRGGSLGEGRPEAACLA